MYPWLKIIEYTGSPSEKRNYAAQHAKGEIIAFIDDDASPKNDWLENIVGTGRDLSLPKKNTIVAVCGPGILPKKSTFLEQVFDATLTSRLGSGSYTYRFQKEDARFVDDYPLMNFAINKKVFEKAGGLLNHWPGEDSKLCEWLVNHKYKIEYYPKIVVYHHRKKSLFKFLKQHSRFGFKRGYFFAEGDKNSRKLIYILPSFFLIYLVFLPFSLLLFKNSILLLPMSVYFFGLVIFAALQVLKRRGLFLSLVSTLVLLLLHLTYAIYFVKGYISGGFQKIKFIHRLLLI